MHKYLRAVGFSGFNSRESLQALIDVTMKNAQSRAYTTYEDNILLAEYSTCYGTGMGITVCGEMGVDDTFVFEYCYPYFHADNITTAERVTVERHAADISFAGVVEDERVGITIIFYLLNRIAYIKRKNDKKLPDSGSNLSLTGLSLEGTIMMPLLKEPGELKKAESSKKKRNSLIEKARQGDETAIESLTLDDMDMYSQISRKIKNNDIYTLVDTYFMPYGIECDQYSILGEILDCRLVKNLATSEEVYQMLLMCNELKISICINKEDVMGEPQVGRRFKGNIWLQGYINYPD